MGYKFSSEYRFHTKILLGLLFSSCGDALLDYKKADLFPFGMIAFAVAHFFYISGKSDWDKNLCFCSVFLFGVFDASEAINEYFFMF